MCVCVCVRVCVCMQLVPATLEEVDGSPLEPMQIKTEEEAQTLDDRLEATQVKVRDRHGQKKHHGRLQSSALVATQVKVWDERT